ncbi:MAG: tRNA pseudouridine(13) synthase TruD [Planctomycetes bacterium]|nr:tRNA pseudouridine(13) synthase TruD [Planctomycetota bacterium]
MNPERTPDGADSGAYLTADIPGIGGVIKQRPQDFLVDEMPQYQPCGSGEHVYLLVQKTSMTTEEMLRVVAKHFGVGRGAIGVAGRKDKQAITRQVVSVHVPGKTAGDFPFLEHERIGVLWSDQHTNKLRRGHLRGNRFSIKIREVSPASVVAASRVLKRLAVAGAPNRIGEQRFGLLANNHEIGRALIRGDFVGACDAMLAPRENAAEDAPARALYASGEYEKARDLFPRGARTELRVLNALAKGLDHKRAMLQLEDDVLGFYLSAFQGAVFNAVLDDRLAASGLNALRHGDIAMKHDNRACFAVDDAAVADPTLAARLAKLEISPTGPMWGVSMMRAAGDTDRAEVEALARFGVTPRMLEEWNTLRAGLLSGERRPLRVPLIDPEVEGGVDEHGAYVRCAFELPRGAFATVAMREVMKPKAALFEEGEEE